MVALQNLACQGAFFFPANPFPLAPEDREFLLGLRQTSARVHKNVAYRPLEDRLTGLDRREPPERAERLRAILRKFSDDVTQSLGAMLPAYAGGLRRDLASFRPLEERGRPLRLRARNDLLHTDAFPTRPTRGDRILRVFTNLNPTEPRVWHTSETFETLAHRFAREAGLPRRGSREWGVGSGEKSRSLVASLLGMTGSGHAASRLRGRSDARALRRSPTCARRAVPSD